MTNKPKPENSKADWNAYIEKVFKEMQTQCAFVLCVASTKDGEKTAKFGFAETDKATVAMSLLAAEQLMAKMRADYFACDEQDSKSVNALKGFQDKLTGGAKESNARIAYR